LAGHSPAAQSRDPKSRDARARRRSLRLAAAAAPWLILRRGVRGAALSFVPVAADNLSKIMREPP